jgi:hypothetical protein
MPEFWEHLVDLIGIEPMTSSMPFSRVNRAWRSTASRLSQSMPTTAISRTMCREKMAMNIGVGRIGSTLWDAQ